MILTTARRIGKYNVLIQSIIPSLKEGIKVDIIGCTDPQDIVRRLEEQGITGIKFEAMTKMVPLLPIYDTKSTEGKIVGFEGGGRSTPVGFKFYLDTHEQKA